MRIAQLQVKNYRSIKDTGALLPTKLFALIGKNNSGKSTLGRAIQLLWGEVEVGPEDFHKGTSDKVEIFITLTDFVEDRNEKYKNEDGNISICFECEKGESPKYYINDENVKVTNLKKDVLPELLVIPAIRNPENESNAGGKSYLKQLIALILKEQVKTDPMPAVKSEELGKKKLGEVSEDEIQLFLEHKRRREIEHLSENVNANFQNILSETGKSIEISPKGDLSKFYTEYSTRIKDDELDGCINDGINILSCGTGLQSIYILSLLQTYADVKKCNDSILLVEEPEVYLHPDFQRKMFAALREIATDNQVIYTTHSPIMIGELWADDSVRLVTLKNGQTVIECVNIESVISELGIRYEDVLNPNMIVFVEGKTDIEFFEQLILCLKPELEATLSRLIKFIPSDGYRSIDSFAYMKIINSQNVNADFYIIGDSDGFDPELRRQNLKTDINKKIGAIKEDEDLLSRIKILTKYSIESYLLDRDMLHSAFNDIEIDKLEKLICLYQKKYNDNIVKVREGKLTIKEFGKYFVPKHLFNNDIEKHPAKYTKFSELFDDDSDFLDARKQLATRCEEINREGGSFIRFILTKADLKSEIISEPIQIINDMLHRLMEDK